MQIKTPAARMHASLIGLQRYLRALLLTLGGLGVHNVIYCYWLIYKTPLTETSVTTLLISAPVRCNFYWIWKGECNLEQWHQGRTVSQERIQVPWVTKDFRWDPKLSDMLYLSLYQIRFVPPWESRRLRANSAQFTFTNNHNLPIS